MSRAINTSLATIQFQVNARQASAAMQALQNMSNDLNREIDKVKKNINNLGEGVPKDNPDLLNYQQQLRGLESQLKDVQKAQRDFLKGAKAADQLWKAAGEGNIESLSFRSIKAGINGLKKRQEGLSPGDAKDMQDWRIIKEVIDEADRVVKQAGADVQNVVQTIREGGKVSEQTMRQTINTLKELKGSVDETDAEYRTYGNDLDFVEAKLQEFSDAQRRAKGEIVDANDARREMNKLTEEGAAAAKREAEEAEQLVASLKQESEELVRKRGEIKQNIEDTQNQIDENHKLIEEKHRQLAADEETFNAEQQSRRESIDGLKQQAKAERKLANEKSDAAETHRRAAELQAQNGASQETLNEGERKYIELLGEATEANNKAAIAESKVAEAESEATQKQVEFNQKQQEGLDNINQMAQGNQALQQSIDGLNGELEQNSKDIADNANKATEAEQKKQQAQQLTIKRMEEMLAALRKENNEVIPANTEKWRENEAEINRLSGALEKMKETARIDLIKTQGQEALSFFNDKNTEGKTQADTASAAETAEKVKALAAYRDVLPKDTDAAVFERIDEILREQSKLLKETTGEWMSYKDAKELASKAGGEGFLATTQQMQQAVQAMERQRDALIKTIQLKQKDGNATADEEAQLETLEKELKDLKFEQDNFNMSHKHMQDLLKEPTQADNLDELRAAIKRADGELKRMEGSLGQNNKQYQAFAEQVRNAKNQLKEMEGQAKASATAWEKAWSRLKTYVVMYMGFNAVWQKMVGTADDLMELSDKMGEVRKTTGFTADEVGRLSDNLAKLDTRTSLTGLMEFSSLAGSIGMKTQEQVQGFTEAANMLAVSLPEMGNEASRTLMKIADATGDLEKNGGNVRETLERVGSTIIALRANSAAAAGPITDFVSRVGAVGAQAGISIDQIAALGATVDALGGRVEMSATALSRMIPAIKNNTFEVAKAIGMTEKELKGMTGMEQMVAIFRKLHDSVKQFDMTTEDGMNSAADAVENMLGRSVSMQDVMKQLNQQGARAGIVFGLLSQNVDKLEEQLDTASQAYQKNTALMDEYNKMNDTTAAKWARLKNELEEIFVGDRTQRFLGSIIDGLRIIVNFISGRVNPLLKICSDLMWTFVAAWTAFKLGLGEGLGIKAIAGLKNFANAIKMNIVLTWQLVTAQNAQEKSAIRATMAQQGLNKAMRANVWGAIIAAIGFAALKIYDYVKAANDAGKAQQRLNEAVSEGTVEAQREVGHLNNVIKALDNAKMSAEGRQEVIDKFNNDYSTYIDALGIEIKTVQDLKDNYDLLAASIRKASFERVRDKFKEQELEPLIKEAIEQGVDLQTSTNSTLNAVVLNDAQQAVGKFSTAVTELTEKNLKDFRDTYKKELRGVGLDPEKATLEQIKAASTPQNMQKLTNQAFQRGPQSLNEYLANLIDKGEIKTAAEAYKNVIRKEFSNGAMYNAVFDEQMNYVVGQRKVNGVTVGTPVTKPIGALGGEKSAAFNEKLYDNIEKFVNAYLKVKERGEQIDAAFSPYVRNDLLGEGGGTGGRKGGGNNNPYGDYDRVKSDYNDWDANALVDRRKEMLERVRALANGADVQAVLSEDAKFISEAVRKNIKTTNDAIEWYNTERLKIQDALHAKYLTNTGDWMDPKQQKIRKKLMQDDMKAYLEELDAYYTERKTEIDRARNDEEISEAEAWNRNIKNEAEWHKRRAELQIMYSNKHKQIAEDEQDAISAIIAERTGDDAKYIKATIANTRKFSEAVKAMNDQGAKEYRKFQGDLDLGSEKDWNKVEKALTRHMKAIEDIVNKERPFNGIAKNLQDNLGKMGILTADLADDADSAAEELKRVTFLLGEAENAYTMTVEKLLDDMRRNGFEKWADAISKDTNMQQGMLAMLRTTFDSVQDAIKKESSIIKKQVEIMMQDITEQVQADTTRLQILQNSVQRANSLIGAGAASERVADKLAIKQIQMQITLQETRIRMLQKRGSDAVALLRQEAELAKQQDDTERAKQKLMDAQNVEKSVGLTLTKEQVELDKQRVALAEKLEESQNRLYTSLKEWGDLIASSLKDVFEASNAGNKEYYNELAKYRLTGKGGPGAGTYVVIDNASTEDAEAHYEYLSEREALERQHEIEVENARAEAWRKMWDSLNEKMNEQITDWMNAAMQNQAIDANTNAVLKNTEAIAGLTSFMQGNAAAGLGNIATEAALIGTPEGTVVTTNPAEQAITPDQVTEWTDALSTEPWRVWEEAGINAVNSVQQAQKNANQQMQQGTQSTFAKMTAAANLYGIAYQTMSNDNLDAEQKWEMFALQAAGQAAIAMLTTDMLKADAKNNVILPGLLGKFLGEMPYPAAMATYAIVTAMLGGLMGMAMSKVAKSKSQISQVTGASSASAGKLTTGMLQYAEGNVNEFTDPGTLTPGRQYNVDAANGKTYRARYTGRNPKTHLTKGPEFHLVGEEGQEAIIDARTTRQIRMNDNGIWHDIQTLYNGGSLASVSRRRRGRGVAAFADGNLDDFEPMAGSGGGQGFTPEMALQMQASLDRNSEVMERALTEGIKAIFDVYGKGGLVDSYDTGKKTVSSHGERY